MAALLPTEVPPNFMTSVLPCHLCSLPFFFTFIQHLTSYLFPDKEKRLVGFEAFAFSYLQVDLFYYSLLLKARRNPTSPG
jgi:hypothetical protein